MLAVAAQLRDNSISYSVGGSNSDGTVAAAVNGVVAVPVKSERVVAVTSEGRGGSNSM